MNHSQFLRIKKLTGKGIIQVAARHNHREILAERGAAQDSHIDPARTGLNCVLRGPITASGVADMAQSLMGAAKVNSLRKDAVRALEIIFSLPPDTVIDQHRYFEDAIQWAERYFKAPVISAIVHLDEAAPHCHVLVLPLVQGRMIGSKLMGNRAALQARQSDFHLQVGERYGLIRQAPQKPFSAAVRRKAVDSAFDVLESNSGMNPALLRVLVDAHLNNPVPLMLALGLEMPKPRIKGTFAGIMIKPCKPEKPIGFIRSKPIGFDAVATSKKEQSLSCVGFHNSSLSISTPDAPKIDDGDGDYIRERDTDYASSQYDPERGEFIKPPAKVSRKTQVIESVRKVLSR